ncbi:MAG: hypothetical protein J6Y99_00110 [Bacteroidales bacterium]|nr:hypothetical protein [Bacteroidales bacterium]
MRLINENEYNDLLVSLTDKALLCKLSTNDVLVNGQESVYFILLEEEEKDLSNIEIFRKFEAEINTSLQAASISRNVINQQSESLVENS